MFNFDFFVLENCNILEPSNKYKRFEENETTMHKNIIRIHYKIKFYRICDVLITTIIKFQ